jgi:DNA polymerase V
MESIMNGMEIVNTPLMKATGFASPAQGYEEEGLDFNRLLFANPPATVVMVCDTQGLGALGIPIGAYLVVDRSRRAKSGDIVVMVYENEFLCREICIIGRSAIFSDGSNEMRPGNDEFEIVGVVRAIVRVM